MLPLASVRTSFPAQRGIPVQACSNRLASLCMCMQTLWLGQRPCQQGCAALGLPRPSLWKLGAAARALQQNSSGAHPGCTPHPCCVTSLAVTCTCYEAARVQDDAEGGLNMTHTIHRLQFGTPVKQLQHPLDGARPASCGPAALERPKRAPACTCPGMVAPAGTGHTGAWRLRARLRPGVHSQSSL